MMKSIKVLSGMMLLGAFVFLAGCQPVPREDEKEMEEETTEKETYKPDIQKAICVLHPTEGNNVTGTVTFTKSGDAIRVQADLRGLTEGKHGFHIHEYGDCSAPDATSAGGHFNPEDKPHAGPMDKERHVGDLGNIVADAEGNGTLSLNDTLIAFHGEHSIIGRAIVVHADEDDLTSQPTGNAGPRVACGVIGIDE